MSDETRASYEGKCYASTPPATLEQWIMDGNVPKNEREWWAKKEIDRLRAENGALRAALIQARGALMVDAMVQDDGSPYGTTMEALDAIAVALKEPRP